MFVPWRGPLSGRVTGHPDFYGFFVLLLGMHLGALAYLLYIWKKGILRTEHHPQLVQSQ
jgi:hypothetical protein